MSDDGFIGLPPGILPVSPDTDSSTVRRDRPERTRTERPEIVFFPAGAAPAPAPVAPVEPVAPEEMGVPVEPEPVPVAEVPVEAPPAPPPAPPVAPPAVELPPTPVIDDATRAVPSRHAAASWRLAIPGHDEVVLDGVLFLGRNPVATGGQIGARVLAIDDTSKSVSKTHAMLEVDSAGLWVHDLDSTNGVWVVPAGEDAIEVVPGTRVAVPAGADLEIGDVVIQVEHS